MRPRLLDLFCGPGGAAMGFLCAGWDVTGVDVLPQPWYPGTFVQADALTYPLDGFDAIHASPPCQLWASGARFARGKGFEYPDHLTPTLARLGASVGVPWVVENVPGSPIRGELMLCGTMFGLPVMRHRYFVANWALPLAPADCYHPANKYNVYDSGPARKGTDRTFCDAMGVTWAPTSSMVGGIRHKVALEAIPPAYTAYIGRRLMEVSGSETKEERA